MGNWYPNLEGNEDEVQGTWRYKVAEAVRVTLDTLYGVIARMDREAPQLVTRSEFAAGLDPKRIRRNLQLSGRAPLNVSGLAGVGEANLVGLHVNRPPSANQSVGTLYWETDRTVLFIIQLVSGAPQWTYVDGYMLGTISPDQKPSDLGTNDARFIFYSTDFDHAYRWTGSAWILAPGEDTPGRIAFYTIAPGTGWQLCDGTSTTRSTTVGGTAAVTVPDYSAGAYLKAETTLVVGPTAASGLVAAEAAHTHDIDHNHASVTSGTPSATETVDNDLAASTVAVASDVHTHAVDLPALGTTASGAGSSHQHGPGTLELDRTELLTYYRL